MSDNSIELTSDHIERHVGKIETVLHEVLSDIVHVDVHVVAPHPDRPYYSLITSGMSDLPMSPVKAAESCRFAELMICLPAHWPMQQEEWKNEAHYWPIRWLKLLARFPHKYKTWLWFGHTMPNGDPAEPLGPNTKMNGMMLIPPLTVSTDFWKLRVRDDKIIHFFAIVPLYQDEMDLKLKKGAETIVQGFEKAKYSELLDLSRRSVAASPWWKLF